MTDSVASSLDDLARTLGLDNRETLERALTHPDNRNLAWLGDAVLNLAVTEDIFNSNPDAPRGTMDARRQSTVTNEHLKQTAGEQLYREGHVRVPPSERDPSAKRILATAYEAVAGLIFLERGFGIAAEYVRRSLNLTANSGKRPRPFQQ